jgi:hypothetical protein
MSQPVAECGGYKNLTNLSGSGVVSTGPCQLIGFYVNSTTVGTLVLRNGGASGEVMCGTITPAIGFHRFPANVGVSLYATVGGTLDVTFFFAAGS